MAQKLKASSAFPEDLSFAPSILSKSLTTTWNSTAGWPVSSVLHVLTLAS